LATETNIEVYQIVFGKEFLKELKKIIKGGNKRIEQQVKDTFKELKLNPHRKRPKLDLKLISSKSEAVYRVRIGKYRLVYQIDEPEKKIFVTMIFPRGKGYQSIFYLLDVDN